jgi:N-acetylmuramoyl-L-alanine amidase
VHDLPVKTTTTETGKKENVSSNAQFHTVQRGESLYSISKKYNIPVAKLKQLNEMKNNKIIIGQKLRVG